MLMTLEQFSLLLSLSAFSTSPPLEPMDREKIKKIQQQLTLLIRQRRMGLIPVDMASNKQYWLSEIDRLIPGLLDSHQKDDSSVLHFEETIRAPIRLPKQTIWLEVSASYRRHSQDIVLLDWRKGSADLTWLDRLKIWAVCEHYHNFATCMKMQIAVLQPNEQSYVAKHSWNNAQHEKTQNWIRSVLTEQPLDKPQANATFDLTDFNFNAIEEVPIVSTHPFDHIDPRDIEELGFLLDVATVYEQQKRSSNT